MVLTNDQEVASLQKDITSMRRLKADFEERCNSMTADLKRYEDENAHLKSTNKTMKVKIGKMEKIIYGSVKD